MKPQLSVFNFSVTNQTADSVDIYVDGYIVDSPTLEIYKEFWGDETSVSYKSFRDSIPAGVRTVNVFVNSGGGHVGDAMAIHDFLQDMENKGVTVNREGRGIVASAATYLVMGKNSKLSENCLFMIHEVSGGAWGNVSEMENQVKAMRKFNDLIVDFYSKKTGLSATVIGNMMKAETWLNASEAKDKGFVSSVGNKVTLTNTIKADHWQFSNTAMLNTYNSFISNSNSSEMETNKITDAITKGFNTLLEKLGIKDKATEENVQNAFKDFSKSITDALKDAGAPDEESINKLVNTAVTEAFKNLGTNEAFKTALADATKNSITKKDFDDAMEKLTNSIADKLGNRSSGKEEDEDEGKGERKRTKNRFSGQKFWNPEK